VINNNLTPFLFITKLYKHKILNNREFKVKNFTSSLMEGVQNKIYLNPSWVTGLTDAEGSFIISIYKRSDSNNWQINPSFELWLHTKDIKTLQELKDFFL
jgi:LAGLIDADG endonuclease